MEFLNEHVAVTGASGGIGRVLCEHLTGLGLTVFGLDLVRDPDPPPGVRSLPVDLTVASSVDEAVASVYELASGPVPASWRTTCRPRRCRSSSSTP
jgi:NAD(P)-dependent dehydrogenase (short-subunit alcohol dehydrogenase family)